jgi:hypothetical protein
VKKTLVICLALVVFASLTAMAATKDSVVTINGGKQTVSMHHSTVHHPAQKHEAKYTIYSNLGTGTDVYYADEGWTISGSSSAVGESIWIATPFTPTASATATELSVGVGYVEGTNEVAIALVDDSNGLPEGKVLKSWNFKNMFTFGDCCTLDTVKDKKGIKVKKGTQYWVEVYTNTNDEDLWGAWCFNYNFTEGNFAYNINGEGWDTEDSYFGAFGVFGKK